MYYSCEKQKYNCVGKLSDERNTEGTRETKAQKPEQFTT